MNAPIFIVGASRSGTTMLRLLLNSHSKIAVPRELKYFSKLPFFENQRAWRNPITENVFRSFVQNYFTDRQDLFKEIDRKTLVTSILNQSRRDWRTPYVMAMEALMLHFGKERWGEKTPDNLFSADIIIDMFPDGHFVYVVRDPRAVVHSMNSIQYYSGDTIFNAHNWRQAATDGYNLMVSSVPERQRTVIKYEDLAANPEQVVSALCAFLGESFEPSMLEFYKSTQRHMPATIRTPSIKAPVSQGNVEKWRKHLSRQQVASIEAICGDQMQAHGYALTGATLNVKNRVETALKTAYWKWQRNRYRTHRAYDVSFELFARLRSRMPERQQQASS